MAKLHRARRQSGGATSGRPVGEVPVLDGSGSNSPADTAPKKSMQVLLVMQPSGVACLVYPYYPEQPLSIDNCAL